MNIKDIINEEIMDTDITNIMGNIPDGYEHNILDETFESTQIINKLAGDILELVGDMNYNNNNNNNRNLDDIVGIQLNSMTGDYGDLTKYIKNSNVTINFYETNNSNTTAQYESPEPSESTEFDPHYQRYITINYGAKVFYTINKWISEGKFSEKNFISILKFYMQSPLIHELQHFYDEFRSSGKFNDYNKRYKADKLRKNVNADPNSIRKAYLNLPHEVIAFFTQVINKTKISDVDSNNRYYMLPINDVIRDFINIYKIENYNLLNEKQKRNLIKKVSQYWHLEKEKLEKNK